MKQKCKNTEHAVKLLVNKLNDYQDDVKKHALEDAIMNSWKSVYPENGKHNKQDNKKPETGNQFLKMLADMEE
ncbi:hypothetical protein DSECCO2_221150 [anaerobic digester metagenome]